MQLTVNGEVMQLDDGLSVAALIEKLDLDVKKIAVERNLEVVSHSRFAKTVLQQDDEIEIIHFIGGG